MAALFARNHPAERAPVLSLFPQRTKLRQSKYLNNVIEQDHRNIKRIVKPMMGFKSFNSARKTLSAIEAMSMIRKGQVKGIEQGNSVSQAKFVEAIFGIAA
ncbi:DDE-type integrase/transposase/recombinase [Leptolyngbya sp. FACHB-711]|nr:DDE-type integrase/transposase/recombinase [Leptolyngbya sp. FACHB-711]